jgi:hypothetical protein
VAGHAARAESREVARSSRVKSIPPRARPYRRQSDRPRPHQEPSWDCLEPFGDCVWPLRDSQKAAASATGRIAVGTLPLMSLMSLSHQQARLSIAMLLSLADAK